MNTQALSPTGAPPTTSGDAPPSKRFVAIGFVAASLVTVILTTTGGIIAANYQADRNEKIQQITAFTKSTQDFDPLVKAYFIKLNAGKDIKLEAVALDNNIQQQHILLGAARSYLTGENLKAADEYRDTLVNVDDALDHTTGVLDARPVAQGVADAAAERERVIASLRHSAGLAAVKTEPGTHTNSRELVTMLKHP